MIITGRILPSIAIGPAAVAVGFWLLNPLLNKRYPKAMQATREKFLAGGYSQSELYTLGIQLQAKRNRIHATTAVEPRDGLGQQALFELLDSTHITRSEAKDLRYKIITVRPSEYPWLRKPIEAAIRSRAAKAEELALAA
jgi:hypothetical protein